MLVPEIAVAHDSVTAAAGFNAGLLHPWLPAEQTMSLLAAALLAGRYCGDRPMRVLAAFSIAFVAGLAIPPSTFTLSTIGLCLMGLALAASALVALNASLPAVAVVAFTAAAGLLDGIASAPDPDHWDVVAAFVAGNVLRAALIFSIPLVVADWFIREKRWQWAKIGIRMVAAWIAAIALLMQALILATP
ncbi:HupE/UreJ family protein [Hoeflea poritis]|uniref:HupE/UreJ family protein n=1 Tax=Hoeflea poritis TaxID=2993659 RepID=A0ABT4VH91_9HYPH|nr:HupE/UreJ family protein [Hoeflea poritis]MDA4844061.1 HupE/UreJ family protein [Hoeflea poritis]